MANHLVEYPEHCGGTYKARGKMRIKHWDKVPLIGAVLLEQQRTRLLSVFWSAWLK